MTRKLLTTTVILSVLINMSYAAEPAKQRFDLSRRASEIDSRTKEHPEIGFVFKDDKGKVLDLQHAVVDTRVPQQGKLVIWLMGYNSQLFDRLTSYGLHAIQVHYANGWFGKFGGQSPGDDGLLPLHDPRHPFHLEHMAMALEAPYLLAFLIDALQQTSTHARTHTTPPR